MTRSEKTSGLRGLRIATRPLLNRFLKQRARAGHAIDLSAVSSWLGAISPQAKEGELFDSGAFEIRSLKA
jgi:hypothetical protein